jgi:hypothetical protein
MVDKSHGTTMTDVHSTDHTSPRSHAAASEGGSGMRACGMAHKGLTGLCWMVACCAAPLLLALTLPVLGSGLGGRTASVVSTLTVLACPVSMMLMMWMMRRQGAGAHHSTQEQPVSVSHMASTAPPTPAVNSHQGTI